MLPGAAKCFRKVERPKFASYGNSLHISSLIKTTCEHYAASKEDFHCAGDKRVTSRPSRNNGSHAFDISYAHITDLVSENKALKILLPVTNMYFIMY